MPYQYTVLDRFLKYVQIDTQADPKSSTVPSSLKQLDMSRLITQELKEMGIVSELTDQGYVYGYLPANIKHKAQKVFFCAHMDTAPDCSGTNVKPVVHRNYQGGPLPLPDRPDLMISPEKFPNLKKKIGHDIITASGNTLLGADDKAGVAIIMDAMHFFVSNPEVPHGDVRVLFTTDEEIGRGVAHVNIEKLDSDFGYTLDGGDLGDFEDENFSADFLTLTINGVSSHPCCAKGLMENSIKIASAIIDRLPKDRLSPESTEKREGFIHPTRISGKMESTQIEFLLRDFDTPKLEEYRDLITQIAAEALQNYPGSNFQIDVKHQYRNMKDVLDQYPHVRNIALNAMQNCGINPNPTLIRGGTDGATLSHMGLPCPNIFAGEQGIHSIFEWVSVQDMQKAVDTIIEICRLIATQD